MWVIGVVITIPVVIIWSKRQRSRRERDLLYRAGTGYLTANIERLAVAVVRNASVDNAPTLDLSSEIDVADWETAYKVQDQLHAYLSHAQALVGRKIGFNSPAHQTKIGITDSGFGRCYKLYTSKNLRLQYFTQLAVEPEIFAKITTDIPPGHTSSKHNYTLAVGLEVLDLRNSFHLCRHIPSLLAQNIFTAGLVPPQNADTPPSPNQEEKTAGIFKRNSTVVPTTGAPQDPHDAVRDIIRHFHARGETIRKDEWLALGSHCRPVIVTEPCEFSFEIEGKGTVQLRVI